MSSGGGGKDDINKDEGPETTPGDRTEPRESLVQYDEEEGAWVSVAAKKKVSAPPPNCRPRAFTGDEEEELRWRRLSHQ